MKIGNIEALGPIIIHHHLVGGGGGSDDFGCVTTKFT